VTTACWRSKGRGQVSIRIKNRDTDKYEERVLHGVEFIRRFLLHALPVRFHRIRYRGYLHAPGKPTLQWLQVLLDARIARPSDSPKLIQNDFRAPIELAVAVIAPMYRRATSTIFRESYGCPLVSSRLFWQLVKMDWNASVDPAGRGANAVKSLGKYVQRSVISDNRVLAIEGEGAG
jgi:hypothetical protein